jgi:L-aminopeptidase/D-esterase-like protein
VYGNLCDVPGVLVGHATDEAGVTGCTAVLFDAPGGAVAGVDVRGASPGTRETDLLSPAARVSEVHAILLTGGSAFGLAAASGVVRFLEEQGVGYDVGVARVPIVPAAVIFDLAVGSPTARPNEAMGYEAASSARSWDYPRGSVGAGTGATVGKLLGPHRAMKGGLGSASVSLEGGLVIGALAVVNALGNVRDPSTGRTIAGPRLDDGTLADGVSELAGVADGRTGWGRNTTLGLLATNARLTKPEAARVALMAHDGLARAIEPVHTGFDGDAVFAASLGGAEGGMPASADLVGALGARLMAEAVIDAASSAEGLPGLPSASDLRG